MTKMVGMILCGSYMYLLKHWALGLLFYYVLFICLYIVNVFMLGIFSFYFFFLPYFVADEHDELTGFHDLGPRALRPCWSTPF